MRIFLGLLIIGSVLASPAYGQVLFTAQSAGKSHGSIYLFGTGSKLGSTYSANNWVGVVTGMTGNHDLVTGYGDMVSAGNHVTYAALGDFLAFPTARKLGFDTALFNLA